MLAQGGEHGGDRPPSASARGSATQERIGHSRQGATDMERTVVDTNYRHTPVEQRQRLPLRFSSTAGSSYRALAGPLHSFVSWPCSRTATRRAASELAAHRRPLLEEVAGENDPSDALLFRLDPAEHREGLARLTSAALGFPTEPPADFPQQPLALASATATSAQSLAASASPIGGADRWATPRQQPATNLPAVPAGAIRLGASDQLGQPGSPAGTTGGIK